MEEEFEEARRDQEWAEEEYEELKSSHDEIQHLLYRFMGGNPCKVDLGSVEKGRWSAAGGTYLHHQEQIRLTCDEGFQPYHAVVKTCVDGSILPPVEKVPVKCVSMIKDCDYIKKKNKSAGSGIYTIRPLKNDTTEMEVYCDMEGEHGWIVMQRRFDGNVSFARTWEEYSNGFGSKSGEHWLGLRQMYEILRGRDYILRVEVEKFEIRYSHKYKPYEGYSEYTTFYLGPESENFTLTLDGYSGNAGDAFIVDNSTMESESSWKMNVDSVGTRTAQNMQFSTLDRQNDMKERNFWAGSCSEVNGNGGWWFNGKDDLDDRCAYSCLNGQYMVVRKWRVEREDLTD